MGRKFPVVTRRSVLHIGLRALAAAGLQDYLSKPLLARSAGLERALVCVYLFGGNDSNNLIVPLDHAPYDTYAVAREGLAVPAGQLLPVFSANNQAQYGFHPALSQLRDLYNARVLAVVANVGPLVEPVTKASYRARTSALPDLPASHLDESLAYLPGGFTAPGWAARVAGWALLAPRRQMFTLPSGLSLLSPEQSRLTAGGMTSSVIQSAISAAAARWTSFPPTGLGLQLRQTAALLEMCPPLGITRPVITCSLSGFDTHREQADRQSRLFTQLSEALAAFYEATHALGVAQQVVTCTDTEFNRTLRPNASNGTDHAWGGHQIVLGGAVLGGEIYGRFPAVALDGPDDAGAAGVWIPTTAKAQYFATLASWYGVRWSDLPGLFPHLPAFDTPALGFLS